MAKVLIKYEATNYKYLEQEVPDEVYERVMRAKTALEALPPEKWYKRETNERIEWDNALDELEKYVDYDAPFTEERNYDYIYVNALETEDGEELMGW